MANPFWTSVAQVLVDALDVDARLLQGRLFDRFNQHPSGKYLQAWAADNPAMFEMLVRALSVFAKTYGRSLREKGTVAAALASQLEQMPFEFRSAFVGREHGDVHVEQPVGVSETPSGTPMEPTVADVLRELASVRQADWARAQLPPAGAALSLSAYSLFQESRLRHRLGSEGFKYIHQEQETQALRAQVDAATDARTHSIAERTYWEHFNARAEWLLDPEVQRAAAKAQGLLFHPNQLPKILTIAGIALLLLTIAIIASAA